MHNLASASVFDSWPLLPPEPKSLEAADWLYCSYERVGKPWRSSWRRDITSSLPGASGGDCECARAFTQQRTLGSVWVSRWQQWVGRLVKIYASGDFLVEVEISYLRWRFSEILWLVEIWLYGRKGVASKESKKAEIQSIESNCDCSFGDSEG